MSLVRYFIFYNKIIWHSLARCNLIILACDITKIYDKTMLKWDEEIEKNKDKTAKNSDSFVKMWNLLLLSR